MELKFRPLKASEVECRIATITQKGLQLLLYKDARCDMNILDETVTPFGWQREHKELKGNIYCGVSIKDTDTGEWVTKWDCGSESYTEKEKGESSDSYKRSCFCWGIGRELYTAPFIWIKAENTKGIAPNSKGKLECKDRFYVKHIKVEDGKITELIIFNSTTKQDCFTFGIKSAPKKQRDTRLNDIEDLAEETNTDISKICANYNVKFIDALNEEQISDCLEILKTKANK